MFSVKKNLMYKMNYIFYVKRILFKKLDIKKK